MRHHEVVKDRYTLTAHGHMRHLTHPFALQPLFQGNGNSKRSLQGRRSANASRQKPKALPDDGQQAQMWQQTVTREDYAEAGDSGFGLLHAFVSNPFSSTPFVQAPKPSYLTLEVVLRTHGTLASAHG